MGHIKCQQRHTLSQNKTVLQPPPNTVRHNTRPTHAMLPTRANFYRPLVYRNTINICRQHVVTLRATVPEITFISPPAGVALHTRLTSCRRSCSALASERRFRLGSVAGTGQATSGVERRHFAKFNTDRDVRVLTVDVTGRFSISGSWHGVSYCCSCFFWFLVFIYCTLLYSCLFHVVVVNCRYTSEVNAFWCFTLWL